MSDWFERNRLKLLTGCFAPLIIVLLWFFLSGAGQEQLPALSDAPSSTEPGNPPSRLSESLAKRRAVRAEESAAESAALQAVLACWDKAKKSLTGQALLDAHQEIAKDAVMQLGGGDELLKFLEFLKKNGQGDLREWVMTERMKDLFSSPEKGPAARQWLLGIEDEKVQMSFCVAAGQGFQGPGFKDYLDFFASIHSQSLLMGGYFSEMAKHDPEGAIKGYFAARPPKVDFTSLEQVMASVPTGSDFTSISGLVPGDSQTLAKNARRALFGAWATSAPEDAADYIVRNSKLVHADQLGPVLAQWVKSDPTAAAGWAQGLDPGEHRDIAMASQSRQLVATSPAQAWELAVGIPDAKRREEAMKEVHRQWMKQDPSAADTAWKLMSGEKK